MATFDMINVSNFQCWHESMQPSTDGRNMTTMPVAYLLTATAQTFPMISQTGSKAEEGVSCPVFLHSSRKLMHD